MAGLRPGESFLTAASRDRKAADKRAEENLQREEEKARAREWASSRSVFVPTQLAAKKPPPKKKTVMPGTAYRGNDKRTASQQASDDRRAQVRKLNTETRRKERFQLGLKTIAPKATIYDAVPVGRTKHDQEITRALDHPPPTLSPRELHDWKTKMIGFTTLTPGEKRHLQQQADAAYVPSPTRGIHDFTRIAKAVGSAVEEGVRPVTSLINPGVGGLDPRRGGDVKTPGDLAKKYEEATDVLAGKSISNVIFHGDMPNTLGEAGGLAAGVVTLGPAGKVLRAGTVGAKVAIDVVKAERGIKAALEAGKVAGGAAYSGPSFTGKVIQWGADARRGKLAAAKVEEIRQNAGAIVAARDTARAAGHEDAAVQLEQILAKADIGPNGEFHGWHKPVTDKRVASKLNPKNVAKGIVRGNTKTIRNAQGIHVAGPFTDEDWVEKVIAAFPTKPERDQWAQWYEEFQPAFREMFGDHAEAMMRGFAVSQANNSPTGGLLATLRVLDRLKAGDSLRTITNKGIGTKSLVKTIAKAVEGKDGKVDEGVAAKLSDFIDSFLNKDTRTFMGDHVDGGMPSAIDVHAMRDQGLVDKKLVAKLEAQGLKEGRDFVVDSQGAASGPLYERLSERYEQIARYLNERKNPDGTVGFDGRTDWKPKEVQALGWGATQKTHGVEPENLGSAFLGNTRSFDIQVGKDLTEAEAADVASAMAPHVEKIIEQAGEGSFLVRQVQAGVFGGAHGANPSLHFQIMSSPEVAQQVSDRLARLFPDHNVTAFKVGGSGSKPALRIRGIESETEAHAVWQSLKKQNPKRFGGKGYTFLNGEVIIHMPGGQITAAAKDTWTHEVAPFVEQALRDAEHSEDVPIEFNGANLQTLKGKADADHVNRGGRGGGRRGAVERRTDAEAKRALDGALGRLAKSRARRAADKLAEERGTLDISGFGRRSVPDVPEPQFASEAVPRTAESVTARLDALDAKLNPILKKIGQGLKKEGLGKGTRQSLAKTDKPSYFQTPGAYEQAKIDTYAKRKAAWEKKHGGTYGGAKWTDQWPEWGEDERFVWGDSETYPLESGPEVATDQSAQWYQDLAEEQFRGQLEKLAAEGGENGSKARRMLAQFQERDSLRELIRKNQPEDPFGPPEDLPGFGVDLKAKRLRPPPRSEAQRLEDALRPPSVPPERPTRVSIPAPGGGGGRPPLPPLPVAEQLPGQPFDDDFVKEVMKRMRKELPSAKPVRAEQEALRSEERASRLKIAMHEFDMGGPEAMMKARQALHGELPRLGWNGFDFLDQPAFEALMREVVDRPDFRDWEKVRTIWAIERVMKRGTVPTKSEHALLQRLVGPQVAKNMGDPKNLSIMRKLYNLGLELWNTPRSIMASFDLSAPFRQGLVMGARHPIIFARNMKPMVKALKEDSFLAIMDDIAGDPNFARAEKAKLAIQDVHGSGAGREEAFPGSLAERIPGLRSPIKGSSRAYSAFLNKMRMDVFNHMLEVAEKAGKDIDDPKFLDALGEYINTSTGRGRLPGKAEGAADFLNTFLFSPRLLASRFQILNPVYYGMLWHRDPFVARQAARAALQTLGGIVGFLTLASQIPGAKVGLNPTSSDFGKIRIGDTRIDVAGGFQPLLVLYMRLLKGRTTVASTGENRPLGGYGGKDRWGLLERFMEGKMAPALTPLRDFAHDKKTYVGDPMTLKGELGNMLSPLNFQSTLDTWRQDGYDMAAVAAVLGSIGFGVGAFPDKVPSSTGGGASMPPDEGGGGAPMPDSAGGGGAPMPP